MGLQKSLFAVGVFEKAAHQQVINHVFCINRK